jgi:glycerol-3-phosphate dehydrogenase
MTAASIDTRDRAQVFKRLDSEQFDLVVIGGGVTGAGVARDAALRGLSVALLEAGDYARGTSSRSSKMIHGGLRYLAQGDTALVKEAASERQVLRRIAPHLTRYAPFLVPAPNLASVAKLRAGLWLFEKLGQAPAEERHELWSAAEVAEREPLLKTDHLAAAAVYPEFLTDDARLTLANVRSAAAAGAAVLNYAEVTGFFGAEAVDGVVCRSTAPGETLGARVRARIVVNAAGPWVDAVRALEEPGAPTRLSLTKGVHVVVPHARAPVERTVIMRTEDKRSVFAVPRGGLTYFGTTDTFYQSADVWPSITEADVAYLFHAAERSLKIDPLALSDITAAWSGVRPLIAQAGKTAGEISRKDEIWIGPKGVVTIAGGKLSAYRAMAERIVDLIVERLGIRAVPCSTAETPLPGGDVDPSVLATRPTIAALGDHSARLIELYGAEAEALAAEGGDVAAEARRAVQHEGAVRLEDYWVRRSTRFWFTADGGVSALQPAATAMADLLGWSTQQRAAEITACMALRQTSLSFPAASGALA